MFGKTQYYLELKKTPQKLQAILNRNKLKICILMYKYPYIVLHQHTQKTILTMIFVGMFGTFAW